MKFKPVYLLIATLLLVSFAKHDALAFNFDKILDFGKIVNRPKVKLGHYPEERNRIVEIKKERAPLDYTPQERNFIKDWSDAARTIVSISSDKALNNFALGTGRVDVTFQVRKGVRYALKDVFRKYPEYQRRKVTEEILNANIVANGITSGFLLGSTNRTLRSKSDPELKNIVTEIIDSITAMFRGKSRSNYKPGIALIDGANREERDKILNTPSLMKVARNLLKNKFVIEVNRIFVYISRGLLAFFVVFILFRRLGDYGLNFNFAVVEPLFMAIGLWMLLSSTAPIMDLSFKFLQYVHVALKSNIVDFVNVTNYEMPFEKLAESWKHIANNIGYFPTAILTFVNMLAQIFTYIFLIGLLLHVALGKMISPLWILLTFSSGTKTHAINSFMNWIRSVLVISFIPIAYLCIGFISDEFSRTNLHLVNVITALSAYLLLPMISSALLSRGSGVFSSGFASFDLLVETIKDSFGNLRSSLDNQYLQLQNIEHAPPAHKAEALNREGDKFSNSYDYKFAGGFDNFLTQVKEKTIRTAEKATAKPEILEKTIAQKPFVAGNLRLDPARLKRSNDIKPALISYFDKIIKIRELGKIIKD